MRPIYVEGRRKINNDEETNHEDTTKTGHNSAYMFRFILHYSVNILLLQFSSYFKTGSEFLSRLSGFPYHNEPMLHRTSRRSWSSFSHLAICR